MKNLGNSILKQMQVSVSFCSDIQINNAELSDSGLLTTFLEASNYCVCHCVCVCVCVNCYLINVSTIATK